jgi:signal transduction histidine kinase
MGLVLLLLGDGSIVAMPLAANLSARFSSKPVVLSGGVGLALILPLLSIVSSPIEAACRERQEKGSQGGTVRTHLREPKISDRGNILMFDKGVGLDLRNEPQRRAPSQLIEAERMSAIGRMACSISHDMRHSLTAIYANAEFLERHDICASGRADLLLEIQEAVLAMTERIDSLLQFGSSGRKSPLVHARVSLVVEKAVAAVKFHPDGRNVSITVGKFPPAEADIDARNLESAIYNLLLNACQAATRSTHVPEVKVHLTEVDERIFVTILDNGLGIPASVRRTLFDPFVTAGKPNGTGLGLTLARRIAEEHGGSVCLEESNRERTVFTLSLTKNRSLPLEELKSGRAASKPTAMNLRTALTESTN